MSLEGTGGVPMKIIPDGSKKLVDLQTGEVFRSICIIPEERDGGFVKVFKLFTEKVIKDLKAIGGAISTLMWFIDKIQDFPPNSDPVVVALPEEIARDLGICKRTVKRHLKILREHGYIEQVRKRHYVYRVNPRMVFKGVLRRYFKTQHEEKRRELYHAQAQGDNTTSGPVSSSGNEKGRDLRSGREGAS